LADKPGRIIIVCYDRDNVQGFRLVAVVRRGAIGLEIPMVSIYKTAVKPGCLSVPDQTACPSSCPYSAGTAYAFMNYDRVRYVGAICPTDQAAYIGSASYVALSGKYYRTVANVSVIQPAD
jgi:hypothetical protein